MKVQSRPLEPRVMEAFEFEGSWSQAEEIVKLFPLGVFISTSRPNLGTAVLTVTTRGGHQAADKGDWITRDEDGDLHVWPAGEFRRRWVPLDEHGEELEWCEACGRVATKTDVEGVPLCDADLGALD